MATLDWIVLAGTILLIAAYGAWKTRGIADLEGYFRGDSSENWLTIGLSIMATQASAITFLSMPGQAYEDGMRFLQFYFGQPLAMVVLSAAVVPIYYRLKVFTAYEYLEQRFDLRTRQLTAVLFLIQRGLATGITIYAPAIVLSSVLGWSLNLTNLSIGILVILYTVSGGTKAVSQTQKQQMVVMLGGMAVAFCFIVARLRDQVSFPRALHLAGALGRMNVVDFSVDLESRYTFWSGITGGFFLALSYFGTDQSQVQRYLSGRSLAESRLGLLMNGLLKVPMQFLILLVGVMVFVFYQFEPPPLFFNAAARARVERGPDRAEAEALETAWRTAAAEKRAAAAVYVASLERDDPAARAEGRATLVAADARASTVRRSFKSLVQRRGADTNDADYVFITFVIDHLPHGLVGLLLAVIFCAAMSATASELTALGSTSVVDFYRRSLRPGATEAHYLRAGKVFTALWGVVALLFAIFASMVDNLIQAVNILGSLFYGTILGVFLTGFFTRRIGATAVFIAALVSELGVCLLFLRSSIGYLWFNLIGCVAVFVLSWLIEQVRARRTGPPAAASAR